MVTYQDNFTHFSVKNILERIRSGECVNYFNVSINNIFGYDVFNRKVSEMKISPFKKINVNINYERTKDDFVIVVKCGEEKITHNCNGDEIFCLVSFLKQ